MFIYKPNSANVVVWEADCNAIRADIYFLLGQYRNLLSQLLVEHISCDLVSGLDRDSFSVMGEYLLVLHSG